ncbi:hypothetical protein BC940DRAFT_368319 [Gongronella butleri]|nr:hypothetical protein BC940DRAFT_368319 [Gongronella butleri]
MDPEPTTLTPWSYWQIAFIYAFCVLFKDPAIADIHPPPGTVNPRVLEDAVVKNDDAVLSELMCVFLSNALNRKVMIKVGSESRALREFIRQKIMDNQLDLEINPVKENGGFQALDGLTKLDLLYTMVELQLTDSNAVRAMITHYYDVTRQDRSVRNPLVPTPLGIDRHKRAYWRFGESPYLWREKPSSSPKCTWEIVCRDLDELREFANEQEQSTDARESALGATLLEEAVPFIEDAIKAAERRDRREALKLARVLELQLQEPRELPRRARRKPVRYTEEFFDDAMPSDASDDAYDSASSSGSASRRRSSRHRRAAEPPAPAPLATRPTRSSRRLHGADAIEKYMDGDDKPLPSPPTTHDGDEDNDDDDDMKSKSSEKVDDMDCDTQRTNALEDTQRTETECDTQLTTMDCDTPVASQGVMSL